MGVIVDKETALKFIEEILSQYPTKARKDRAKHTAVAEPGDDKCIPQIKRKD
jgi:hypothetical protein